MSASPAFFNRRGLLFGLSLLLCGGFVATTLLGYVVSRETIRDSIISQDLPLTAGNIYSQIQKDLVRPVLISSTMAHDTFLRDWALRGERNSDEISRYLREVREEYGAFSSFFVSDRSRNYYTADGILKQVREDDPHDIWYFRLGKASEDYVIDVDTDQANSNALTIFINYKVRDYDGNLMGVAGVGLTVNAVRGVIADYQRRYQRTIYFVDPDGKIVLYDEGSGLNLDLRRNEGVGPLVDKILAEQSGSWQFHAGGSNHILQVSYLPELKWYLFVEQNEDVSLAGIRRTLYINLLISVLVSVLIIGLAHQAFSRYQSRIEELATTDEMTGLFNRNAFAILQERLLAASRREPRPISVLLVDIDHFKLVNDRHGHHIGDLILAAVANLLRSGLRESDVAVRWGGEEFLMVLSGCVQSEALRIAEQLRAGIEAARPCAELPELAVTVSIGVSQFDGGDSLEPTISRADQALYAAKSAGRNAVRDIPASA